LNKSASYYGLPIALGSAEVSLLELTAAYSIFPNGGYFRPYQVLEQADNSHKGTKVISPESAWMISDILTDTTRLNGEPLWKSGGSTSTMAWKTGTGYGHHAAWTVAFTPKYTVGVMLRNASKTSKSLVGISAAAPVAARIVSQVDVDIDSFVRPATVAVRQICAESGHVAGMFCKDRDEGDYILGISGTAPCAIHSIEYEEELAFNNERGGLAAIRGNSKGDRLKILNPAQNQKYVLVDDSAEQLLKLKASGAASDLYWFVDGELYKRAVHTTDVYWPLKRGEHLISCSDSKGQSATTRIVVQ